MRALVIGARGAVGAIVVSTLRGQGHRVTTAGRQAPVDGIALDLSTPEPGSLERATHGHDVVINATGVENASLGRVIGDAVLIDISATGSYLLELAANAPRASVVLGAGLAPGLSTVLISNLATTADDAVDVAVMLGSGERHGAAAIAWTTRLIGTQVTDTIDDGAVYNFSEQRVFTDLFGRRRYLRAGLPDQVLIGHDRGLKIRSWLALSSAIATQTLALVRLTPWARGLISHAPPFGSKDWAVTAVNRRTGETVHAAGSGQSHATGVITALTAKAVFDDPPRRPVALNDILNSGELAALPGITVSN